MQLFAGPPAAQALLSHCWGTDCPPLQQANPSGTFRILRQLLSHSLTPTHFTLLENLHYSLQVLPYTGSKRRTITPGSFEEPFQSFGVGSNLWKTVFTSFAAPRTEEEWTLRLCRNVNSLGESDPLTTPTHKTTAKWVTWEWGWLRPRVKMFSPDGPEDPDWKSRIDTGDY